MVFRAKAEIIDSSGTYTCAVERSGPSLFTLEITAPDNYAGIRYIWSGEASSAECALPQSAFALVTKDLLDAAAMEGALTVSGAELSGDLEEKQFFLSADGTGRIQQIRVPDIGYTAVFSEIQT